MKINIDKIGIISSLTCAIHCTVLPIVLILFPVFSLSLLTHEKFEWFMLALSLVLGLSSLCFGYKKHKSVKALSLLAVGILLLLIGKLSHGHYVQNNKFEFDIYNVILGLGGILISLSHWLNNSLCKRCSMCKDCEC